MLKIIAPILVLMAIGGGFGLMGFSARDIGLFDSGIDNAERLLLIFCLILVAFPSMVLSLVLLAKFRG